MSLSHFISPSPTPSRHLNPTIITIYNTDVRAPDHISVVNLPDPQLQPHPHPDHFHPHFHSHSHPHESLRLNIQPGLIRLQLRRLSFPTFTFLQYQPSLTTELIPPNHALKSTCCWLLGRAAPIPFVTTVVIGESLRAQPQQILRSQEAPHHRQPHHQIELV